MFVKSSALVAAAVAVAPVLAGSKPGVNVYFGQTGAGSLSQYCESSAFEYITVSFISASPESDPDTGYPTLNLGAHCAADVFEVDGKKSRLLSNCGAIKHGIKDCQNSGKKVLLSFGGVFNASEPGNDYTVTGETKGKEFADFLWGAFGPYDATWTGPRPFDISKTEHNSVDGFDFDIEHKFNDQTGYVAMVNRLRKHISDVDGNQIITAAPECPLSDEWFKMKYTITNAKFDALFIQFYNNPSCQADNPLFLGFNFDAWVSFLANTKSKDAKIFVGLQAEPGSSGYLEPETVNALIDAYKSRPAFAGISLWDVYTASQNKNGGKNYYESIHEHLVGPSQPPPTGDKCCVEQYTVVPGDYCYLIATSNGITVDQLIALNPGLDSACSIFPGQVLCLKQRTCTVTSTSTSTTSTRTSSSTTSTRTSTTTTSSSSSSRSSSSSTSSSVSSTRTSSSTSTSTSTSTSSSSSSTRTSTSSSISSTRTSSSSSSSSTMASSSSSSTSTSTSSSISSTRTSSSSSTAVSSSSSASSLISSSSSTMVSSSTTASSLSSLSSLVSSSSATSSSSVSSSAASSTITPPPTTTTSATSTSSTSTTTSDDECEDDHSTVTSVWPPTTSSEPETSTTEWTTSTVSRTVTYTVTSCPPEKGDDCPSRGHVTTVVVPWYTTVCPVSATTTPSGPPPTGGADVPVCPGGPNCPPTDPSPTGPKPTGGSDVPVCPGGANCPPTGPSPTGPAPTGPKPTGGADVPVCPGGANCPKESTTTRRVTSSIISTVTIPRPSTSGPAGNSTIPSATKPGGGSSGPTGGASVPVCPGGPNCPKPSTVTAGAARTLAGMAFPALLAAGAFLVL